MDKQYSIMIECNVSMFYLLQATLLFFASFSIAGSRFRWPPCSDKWHARMLLVDFVQPFKISTKKMKNSMDSLNFGTSCDSIVNIQLNPMGVVHSPHYWPWTRVIEFHWILTIKAHTFYFVCCSTNCTTVYLEKPADRQMLFHKTCEIAQGKTWMCPLYRPVILFEQKADNNPF